MTTRANQRRIVDRSSETENYLSTKPVERPNERNRARSLQKRGLGYRDPNKNVAPVLKSFGEYLKPGQSTDENILKDKYSDFDPKKLKEKSTASSTKVEVLPTFQSGEDESEDEVSHGNCDLSWSQWELIELPAWKRPSCTVPIRNPFTKGKIQRIPRPPPEEKEEDDEEAQSLTQARAEVLKQQIDFRKEMEEEEKLFGQHLQELIAELKANNQDGAINALSDYQRMMNGSPFNVFVRSANDQMPMKKKDGPSLEISYEPVKFGINSIALNSSGTQFAVAGTNSSVKIFSGKFHKIRTYNLVGHRVKTQNLIIKKVLEDFQDTVNCARFSKDDTLVGTCSNDFTVRLWTPAMMGEATDFRAHMQPVRCIDFSPDSSYLASASNDHFIKLWRVSNQKFGSTLKGHQNWVRSVRYAEDDPRLLVTSSDDRTVRVWDVRLNECVRNFCVHSDAVTFAVFRHCNNYVASCTVDKMVKIWDLRETKLMQQYEDHAAAVNCVGFYPSGRFVISCSDDHKIKIYDAKQGQLLFTLHGHKGAVKSIDISKDGDYLYSADSTGKILVWNISCLANISSTSASNALEIGNEIDRPAPTLADSAVNLTRFNGLNSSYLKTTDVFASPLLHLIRPDNPTPKPKRRIPVDLEREALEPNDADTKNFAPTATKSFVPVPYAGSPYAAAPSVTSIDSGAAANASSASNSSVDGLKFDSVVEALNTLIHQMDLLTETMSTFDGRLKAVENAVAELKIDKHSNRRSNI